MRKYLKKSIVNAIVSIVNEVAEKDHGINISIELAGGDLWRLSDELAETNNCLRQLIKLVSEPKPRPKPRRRSKKRVVKDDIDHFAIN